MQELLQGDQPRVTDLESGHASRKPEQDAVDTHKTSRPHAMHSRNFSFRMPRRFSNPERYEDDELVVENAPKPHLPLSKRLKHVTWAWFTLCMATGGIASTLHGCSCKSQLIIGISLTAAVPFQFRGLNTIGIIFFLANIVFFVIIWIMIVLRFWWYPYMFKYSFGHPTESLFIPAVAVSFGTILINIVEYGSDQVGTWLNRTIIVLFWFDSGLAFILSITIYLILWSTQTYTISRMTPIWIFPAYPLLIIGPHAAALSAVVANPRDALAIIIGGFLIQGVGFLVSLTVYSAFVYRLMTQKLPSEMLRPGMFVSVGPSAFTCSGVIGMAQSLDRIFQNWPGKYMSMDPRMAGSILTIVANWMSLWLWGLAIWFFFVSLLSNLVLLRKPGSLPFAMTWFSFIFPQTALTKATFRVASAFDLYPLQIVGSVMTVMLVIAWFLVVGKMIYAIVNKDILWPETGEDKSEGGMEMPKDDDERRAVDRKRVTTAQTTVVPVQDMKRAT